MRYLILFLAFLALTLTSCLPTSSATIAQDGLVTVVAGETLYDAALTVLDATLIDGRGCEQLGVDVYCAYLKVDKGATIIIRVEPSETTACRFAGFTVPGFNPLNYRSTPCDVLR